VYTRVVGYYRPVQQFNPGKKAEFAERKTLKNPQSNQGLTQEST
jgi:anaerobic ribonucleoside-triphosphate reductase